MTPSPDHGRAGRDGPSGRSAGSGSDGSRGSDGSDGSDGGSGVDGPETAGDGAKSDEIYYCDLCGNVMLNLHCKLVCETCGYKRDCSDP